MLTILGVIFNTPEVWCGCSYVGKLRQELEESAESFFHSANERERIKSVLVDLSKTSSDFTHITNRALEQLSSGILPCLRCCQSLVMCITAALN